MIVERTFVTWSAVAFAIAAGLWTVHQSVQAQAIQTSLNTENIRTWGSLHERTHEKLDKLTDSVSVIKIALGVEEGRRQGLLQSQPGSQTSQTTRIKTDSVRPSDPPKIN